MDAARATEMRAFFDPLTRSRGKSYFDQLRVGLTRCSPESVEARVLGSGGEFYAVAVQRKRERGESPSFSCSCPHFSGGAMCKHLWATILAWDEQRADVPNGAKSAGSTNELTVSREVAKARNRPAETSSSRGWERRLQKLARIVADTNENQSLSVAQSLATSKYQHWFVISLADHVDDPHMLIRTYRSQRLLNGTWGARQQCSIDPDGVGMLFDPVERDVISMLEPEDDFEMMRDYGARHTYGVSAFGLPPAIPHGLLESLASTQRFVYVLDAGRTLEDDRPIRWDGGPAWRLHINADRVATDGEPSVELTPWLERANEIRGVSDVVATFQDGLVLFADEMAFIDPHDASWLIGWQRSGAIRFPESQLDAALVALGKLAGLPRINFQPDLQISLRMLAPLPRLHVAPAEPALGKRDSPQLDVTVMMKYGQTSVNLNSTVSAVWDAVERAWTPRDKAKELELLTALTRYPFQTVTDYMGEVVRATIAPKWLPELVRELVPQGWEIIAEGKKIRSAGDFHISVTTGIDWFDVDAQVDFDGVSVSLPTLLEAVRKNQDTVVLGDGSLGMLPEVWLKRYAKLAQLGQIEGDAVRFSKVQAFMLDALLADQENVTKDRDFTKLLKKVESFQGIEPAETPRGFEGELRSYQRDGIGWLTFLRDFQFGGCLADDMGLGKTVQVLAMLEGRRTRRLRKGEERRPSLVVVPKSLIFNWMDEASRFTPKLRVINFTGSDRMQRLGSIESGDLLVTTYGTLLRDILKLREVAFDYVILDEAQAIKNAHSQSAKACRLLQASHRLAMTGTPVENHLGELWSLIDFLNPGMLGAAEGFRNLVGRGEQTAETLQWLNRCLKPFILRRTKEQVLTELPAKTEQTLFCEMTPKQAKLYRELADHYRAIVAHKVDELGMNRAKFHVLEALLRLRQAACDPRLLDKGRNVEGAKMQTLLEQLEEIRAEGHKALVFSQFTSLLAIVRREVEKRKWTYEYLDGQTRDRRSCVQRFQNDQECSLFLISLKAGGHGLNLTAADYVFILDPWWNPAVEAQAIDRAHRLGQTRPVIAYRIISKNTVEEKIVELQRSKRDLADAIISADESLISRLSFEDLQLLFS